ncbi:flavin monoamine oxidase family protein [Bacillus sp. Marseille-P3800]|uniref:flavin monoamine oxidase family protein n=1 Tax=Bacillus sp. Marseille-P3800 TaxID=2014782 RepID=UPI000C06F294|nr:NAD(P)/FAD-dependent oxidoreductase [Bacillus sp. Marseille-P3800]
MKRQQVYDLIIIGAGFSGLSAAVEAEKRQMNYGVLEATEKAGGKVSSYQPDGKGWYFEEGAQFVNEDMNELVTWIKQAGGELRETDKNPTAVSILANTKQTLGSMMAENQNANPSFSLEALRGKEGHSIADVYKELVDDPDKFAVLESFLTQFLNQDPEKLSAYAALDTKERFQSEKSDDTHQSSMPLSDVIDYQLSRLTGDIRYQQLVESIDKTSAGYAVHTSTDTYFAEKIVLALPPTVARNIMLPEEIQNQFQDALKSYSNGAVIKIQFVYDHRFWHQVTFNGGKMRIGSMIWTDPKGISVMDSSKKNENYGVLTMFIGGEKAEQLKNATRDELLAIASRLLEDVLGTEAQTYLDAHYGMWVHHPYVGGGFSASILAGEHGDAAALLRKGTDTFTFASSECAEAFPSFMEGALRAGQAAVKRLRGIES